MSRTYATLVPAVALASSDDVDVNAMRDPSSETYGAVCCSPALRFVTLPDKAEIVTATRRLSLVTMQSAEQHVLHVTARELLLSGADGRHV